MDTKQFMQRTWERGKNICPLLCVFGIFTHLFKVDWLHAVDQGVGADFLGNLFKYLVDRKMPGRSEWQRCKVLGEHIHNYYVEYKLEDRLKDFQPKSYSSAKKTKRPPKLKGNAASTRALIKFGALIADRFLSEAAPLESAMKVAAKHLSNCYDCLHWNNQYLAHDALYNSSKVFAIQYKALHDAFGDGVSWRPMPKMHMFLELCSAGTEPQKFWNYRDEDFGGSVAKQSRMKGMWKNLSSYTKHGLDMFRMKNDPPRIRE